MISSSDYAALDQISTLNKSDKMPVLFIGHGSPMNAIGDNEYRRSWQELGAQFGTKMARPQLILCISAHWLTEGWWLTAMAQPKTIHDFGGFPQELFDQQYPAPGDPAAAQAISLLVKQRASAPLGQDFSEWGLDHGAWSVLKPMFPDAEIPVIQLSMDYARAPEDHYALARQLKALRNRGVLIVASGNIVHNLRLFDFNNPQPLLWAEQFDAQIQRHLSAGEHQPLIDYPALGPHSRLAIPTAEHYLPLLYSLGVQAPDEPLRIFNSTVLSAISMTSVVIGAEP